LIYFTEEMSMTDFIAFSFLKLTKSAFQKPVKEYAIFGHIINNFLFSRTV
jgi:hypothetical protein